MCKQAMSIKKRKNHYNIIFIIITSILLFGYFLISDSPIRLWSVIKQAKKGYLFFAFFCMVIYWVLDAVSLYCVAHKLAPDFKFRKVFQTTMLGQFFNCITPFASGGQPVQAYSMVKYGVPLGVSSSILLAKFIIYQTILTIYSMVVLIFKFQYFANIVSGFSYIVFIGFAVNTFVVLFLIGIGFFPRITQNILFQITGVLSKIGIIKDSEKIEKNISEEISNFYESFHFLKDNIFIIGCSSVIVMLELTSFYLVPYFICLSLGITTASLINIIAAGAFVLMVSSFIPLPGASGGAEGSFFLFFGYFFRSTGNIGAAILIWRVLTFYLTILIGSIFTRRVEEEENELENKKNTT